MNATDERQAIQRSVTAAPTLHSGAVTWPAYAACAWAAVFAAMSFYWAAGGTVGSNTIGDIIRTPALARDPAFVAILWATGALKAIAALLALALVRPWGRVIPRWALRTAGWGTGLLLVLYGGANLAVRGLMAVGIIRTPASMHSTAARWHLLLWDPWWTLGGLLFAAATWCYGQRWSGRA